MLSDRRWLTSTRTRSVSNITTGRRVLNVIRAQVSRAPLPRDLRSFRSDRIRTCPVAGSVSGTHRTGPAAQKIRGPDHMNVQPPSQAEDTAVTVQQAAHDASSPMIPGAFEVRVRRAADRPTDAPQSTTPVARTASGDRERSARELEGGGAPSERRGVRGRSVFGRLWRRVFRPTDHFDDSREQ